ncbi:MAG TPA: class I SAM-dependent methyltransferase [Acidobacteriaceae bacterium]|jgi:predicted RNA methylase
MTVLNKLRWSIQHRGVAGTLRSAVNHFGRQMQPQSEPTPHPFDVEHGTDTGGLVSGANLASGHPSDRFIEGYAAVPPSRFRNIMARWQSSQPSHSTADYTFVDLGCGKGRAVLLASQLGFREVVGVELNPSLVAIAQANADRWIAAGWARCPIRIERADAAEFSWPAGPCVAFLFNPFGAALMQRVVDRMALSFGDRTSDLEVLYYKCQQASVFAEHFALTWSEATAISHEDLAADPVADPNDETRAYRLRAQ